MAQFKKLCWKNENKEKRPVGPIFNKIFLYYFSVFSNAWHVDVKPRCLMDKACYDTKVFHTLNSSTVSVSLNIRAKQLKAKYAK